ncbi:hypothetical protein, partial [Brasilonema octagenarum]|uniref:hypothetical protein n=1 Tax=Brasilonema octagenarum TaxID=417105 RepID=UPI001B7CDC92
RTPYGVRAACALRLRQMPTEGNPPAALVSPQRTGSPPVALVSPHVWFCRFKAIERFPRRRVYCCVCSSKWALHN